MQFPHCHLEHIIPAFIVLSQFFISNLTQSADIKNEIDLLINFETIFVLHTTYSSLLNYENNLNRSSRL